MILYFQISEATMHRNILHIRKPQERYLNFNFYII